MSDSETVMWAKRALHCLHLEAPQTVAEDVQRRVLAALDEQARELRGLREAARVVVSLDRKARVATTEAGYFAAIDLCSESIDGMAALLPDAEPTPEAPAEVAP